MIFTGFYGLLFILFVLAALVAFVKFYVIPNGLFDRKGNIVNEPDALMVAWAKKDIAQMNPITVDEIKVIGRG